MLRVITVVAVLAFIIGVAGCSNMAAKAGPKTTVVLEVDPADKASLPSNPTERQKVMEQACDVLKKRISSQSVADPSVTLKGNDRIAVTMRSTKDVAKIIPVLTSTATIEFYHLMDVKTANHPTSYWRMSPGDPSKAKSFVFEGNRGESIDSLTQPQEVLKQVAKSSINRPILTGANLMPNASADIDQMDGVVVNIQFSEQGTAIFREFTRKNKQELLAIFYDNRLLTAPEIREAIPNGKAQISGFKDITEAKEVADMLNSGKMPVRLVVASKP